MTSMADPAWIHESLESDHARLDGMLRRLDSEIASGSPCAPETAAEFRHGLEAHIRWEEEVLFPAMLEADAPRQSRSIESLTIDHRRILESLERIDEGLAASDGPAAAGALRDLRIYLQGHNRDEEIGIYAEADRRLPEEERRRLLERFRPG